MPRYSEHFPERIVTVRQEAIVRDPRFDRPVTPDAFRVGDRVAPFRESRPLRQSRRAEAFLLAMIVMGMYEFWCAAAGTIREEEVEAVRKVAMRTMPRLVRRLEREAAETDESGEIDLPGLVPTAYWAATRWVCSFDIPTTEQRLVHGPPLFARLRT